MIMADNNMWGKFKSGDMVIVDECDKLFLDKELRDETYARLSANGGELASVTFLCLTATFSCKPTEDQLIKKVYQFKVYDYKPGDC